MSPRRRDEPEFTSYYGRAILKEPSWEALDIAGYLFLGGLAGASSLLGAGADLTGRPVLRRAARFGALGAIGLSLAALVHDLGRPSRFLNMLRVAKPTSPMSMGSWLLSGYAPLVGAAAASELTGLLPRTGRAAGVAAAGLGCGVATYTSVLIADTAVPSWHESRQELPFVFAGSAAMAAGGLGLLTAPVGESGPALRMALAGAATEVVFSHRMEANAGLAGQTFSSGAAGRMLTASRTLTAVGTAGALLSRRCRLTAAVGGGCLIAASALTRFGIFAAGVASTKDPRYVVVPQRERLAAAEGSTLVSEGRPA